MVSTYTVSNGRSWGDLLVIKTLRLCLTAKGARMPPGWIVNWRVARLRRLNMCLILEQAELERVRNLQTALNLRRLASAEVALSS